MANLFDILEALPSDVFSGDQIQWACADIVDDYPLVDYSVEYRFGNAANGGRATVEAVEENDNYTFTMPANMECGDWGWVLRATKTSDSRSISIARGRLFVRSHPASAEGVSHSERMLNAIDAELESRVSGDGSGSAGYSINGRSLQRIDIDMLEKMRKRYVSEFNAERRKAGGRPSTKKRLVRFS